MKTEDIFWTVGIVFCWLTWAVALWSLFWQLGLSFLAVGVFIVAKEMLKK